MELGRPTQLTEARKNTILNAVRTGTPLHTAASWAGVADETLRGWRKKADAAMAKKSRDRGATDRRYIDFAQSLDQALADCAIRMQAVVYEIATHRDRDEAGRPLPEAAADKRARLAAATWWLQHRQQADYAARQEITGPDGAPLVDADAVWSRMKALVAGDTDE